MMMNTSRSLRCRLAGWVLPLVAGMSWQLTAFAQAPRVKPRIAVLDLQDKGVGKDVASLLTGVVSNRLADLGIFDVISRDDIRNILQHEQDKIMLGCEGEACLVSIGGKLQGALGAEILIAGEIGMVGTKTVIGLQRIDIKNAKVAKRTERQVEGSREKLLQEIANAAYLVVEDLLAAQSGILLVNVSEPGADVSLDGKLVGTSPLGRLSVPAGPRDVRVSKDGFIEWVRTIQMDPHGVQTLEVTLIPSAQLVEKYERRAELTRLWAWISLGACVLLEAGAIGMRTYTYLEIDPIENDYNAGNYRGLTAQQYWDTYHDDIQRAEILDTTALALGITGIAAGVVSLYLFLEGDDPDRYERFRGLVSPGGAGATWELRF